MNTDLWQAIYDLYHLLADRASEEEKFQRFLESHPIVFQTLGFSNHLSYEAKSGNCLPYDTDNQTLRRPDFICSHSSTSRATVFEIKTPTTTKLVVGRKQGQRIRASAELEGYMAQLSEYITQIASTKEARRRLCDDLNLAEVKSVDGILLIGLSSPKETPTLHDIFSRRHPRISLLHFDVLLDTLAEAYATSRPDIFSDTDADALDRRRGISVFLQVIIAPTQPNEEAVLLDIGDAGADRIQIISTGDYLVAEFSDAAKKLHRCEAAVKKNEPLQIRLEISSHSEKGFSLLCINNVDVDVRFRSQGFNINPNLNKVSLGANHFGRQGAKFKNLMMGSVNKVLSIQERLNIYRYYDEKPKGDLCLLFDGNTFMTRNAKGDMIQENLDRRPILTTRGPF